MCVNGIFPLYISLFIFAIIGAFAERGKVKDKWVCEGFVESMVMIQCAQHLISFVSMQVLALYAVTRRLCIPGDPVMVVWGAP